MSLTWTRKDYPHPEFDMYSLIAKSGKVTMAQLGCGNGKCSSIEVQVQMIRWLRGLFIRRPRLQPCDVCFKMMESNGYGICPDCIDALHEDGGRFYRILESRGMRSTRIIDLK